MKFVLYLLTLLFGVFGILGLFRFVERFSAGEGLVPVQLLIGLTGLVLALLCLRRARSRSTD